MCCFPCAVSWASWLLFTGVPARCVVLRVRCPGPLGSCSLVCPPGVLCRACGVLGGLAPVHPCARSVGCVVCTVSSAAWLLFTGVFALCVVLWVYHSHVEVQVDVHTAERLLSQGYRPGSNQGVEVVAADVVCTLVLHSLDMVYRQP